MITLVKNIRQLVTHCGTAAVSGSSLNELRIVDRPVLVLRDERISAIELESKAPRSDRVIDAGGGLVVPGLVDACATARLLPDPNGEQDWLRAGLEAMLHHGTTSAEVRVCAASGGKDLEGFLSDLQQLAHRLSLRLSIAFLASPRVGASDRGDRISGLIGETIPSLSRRRLATACVIACGRDGYTRKEASSVLRAAHGAGLTCKVQAAGGDGEAYLVASDCEAATIDHLPSALPPSRSIAPLRKAGTVAVLLPNRCLLGEAPGMNARDVIAAGLPIALGSSADLAGGGVYSLWTALSLAVRQMGLSPAEAFTAATLNSAAAIGTAHQVGTLEPGKLADFIVLGVDGLRRIPDFVVGLPIRSVFVGGRDVTRP